MKHFFLVFFCTLFICSYTNAQTIYSYTSATAGTPNAVNANANGTSLTRVNGASAPGSPCSTGFSCANFSSTTTYTTALGAVSITLKPNAGYKLTVTDFSAGIRRSGTGPTFNRFAYSLDGGATWVDKGSNDAPSNTSCGSVATATWNPTDFDVTSTANGVIFRIYAFGASSTGGTYQILNLNINGSVTAVSTCGNPTGLAANNITNTSADLSWGAVTGASGYEYVVNQAATDPVSAGTATTNTTATATGLTPSATYYLHVRTSCSPSFSSWQTIPFITLGCFNVTAGSIGSSAGDTFCLSGSTDLSISGHTTGTGISYQWKSSTDGVAWNNVGTNSALYTTGTLNATTYYKTFVSCAASGKTDSTAIDTITINTPQIPVVTIAVPNNTICAGTPATFTATQLNAGNTPAFAWFKNNTAVGTNSNTYTDNNLNNNDAIICVVTSSATCTSTPDDTSNSIVMTVNPVLTPAATISVTPDDTVCSGTNLTFTVLPQNGGTAPSFQWKKNGIDIPSATNISYATSSLVNNDAISCVVSNNTVCATAATVNSDTIKMTINPVLTPSATISVTPNDTVCDGTNLTFTVLPQNGGTAPQFQWRKNGADISGATNISYTTSSLINNDAISCVVSSNAVCASPATVNSDTIKMTINPVLNPSVSITANPGNVICAGVPVTFTATATNAGTTPVFKWFKNNVPVGTNSNIYTSSTLSDNDNIFCVVISNAVCTNDPDDTSNSIIMTVNPIKVPSATISVTPNDTVCNGTNVIFTVLPQNGGTNPSFQWKKNGSAIVGATAVSYATTTLSNNDAIFCTVTSNAVCATPANVNSDTVKMTVNSVLTPAVSISATPGNIICAGTNVHFTATATNGGGTPQYQWKKNGIYVGANSNTYSDNALSQSDVITCVLTSSEACVTSVSVTSNAITMTVNAVLVPSLLLNISPSDTICAGTTVNFTTVNANQGSMPTYVWRKNGTVIPGATLDSYTSSSFVTGDVISVTMTSSVVCASPASADDDTTITVNPLLLPILSIQASPDTNICSGIPVYFSVQTINAGLAPHYQWKLNGIDMIGATSGVYTLSNLNNGDIISCSLTSNATCATPATVNAVNKLKFKVDPTAPPVVSIVATPGIVINQGQQVTLHSKVQNGSAAPVYKWFMNGVEIPGATDSVYKANNIGTNDVVYVVVYSSEPCAQPDSGKSNSLQFTVTNGVKDIAASTIQFDVFPNPNNGSFVVQGNSLSVLNTNVKFGLLDNLGRVVYEDAAISSGTSFEKKVEPTNIPAGTYYLRVTIAGVNAFKRVVIN